VLAREFRERQNRPGGEVPTNNLFAHEIEHVCVALHQSGGHLQQFCAQFGGGQARGFPAHHGDARSKGAHAFVDAVGLAVDDVDIAIVYAERVGADLRDDGLDALSERGDAGDDFDRTI